MKVLIITNNDIGLYQFRKELIQTILKENEVYIAMPQGDYSSEFTTMGCKLIKTDFDRHGKNPVNEICLLRLYAKIVKTVEPKVILTYTIKPNIYGGIVAANRHIPYIANITGLGTAVEHTGILQKFTTALYKYALRRAAMVFFQNEENKMFMIERHIVKGPSELIPGSGVNLVEYEPSEYPNDDVIHFAYVGRVMKEKGIEQYLDAAEAIHRRNTKTVFHVCGAYEDDYKDRLEQLENKGTIVYHGLVKNMKSVYGQIHCLVHPSFYPEGLSNVLLEASAMARPVITTDRSGCREVVDDGVNGFVVKQRDSADLIEKIEQFLDLSYEEKKQMGLMGRAKVERSFDRQIVISAYMRLINKIRDEELSDGLQIDYKKS